MWPGPIGLAHRAELQRFAARVKGEAGFGATTFQAVFAGLRKSAAPVEAGYIDYLQLRYKAHA